MTLQSFNLEAQKSVMEVKEFRNAEGFIKDINIEFEYNKEK